MRRARKDDGGHRDGKLRRQARVDGKYAVYESERDAAHCQRCNRGQAGQELRS